MKVFLTVAILAVLAFEACGQNNRGNGNGNGPPDRSDNSTESMDDDGPGRGRGRGPPRRGIGQDDQPKVGRPGQRREVKRRKGRNLVANPNGLLELQSRNETVEMVIAQVKQLLDNAVLETTTDLLSVENTDFTNVDIPGSNDGTSTPIKSSGVTTTLKFANGVNILVNSYIGESNGTFTYAGQEMDYVEGSMKWSLEVSNITWCEDCNGDGKNANLICIRVNFAGPGPAEGRGSGKFNLGANATVILENRVMILQERMNFTGSRIENMPTTDLGITEDTAKNYSVGKICFRKTALEDPSYVRFYDPVTILLGEETLGTAEDGGNDPEDTSAAQRAATTAVASLLTLFLAYVLF